MFGQASVITRECRNAIVLPESALHSGSGGSYVLVAEQGRAKLKNVGTGIRENGKVQITKGHPGFQAVHGDAAVCPQHIIAVQFPHPFLGQRTRHHR